MMCCRVWRLLYFSRVNSFSLPLSQLDTIDCTIVLRLKKTIPYKSAQNNRLNALFLSTLHIALHFCDNCKHCLQSVFVCNRY
jgi:hypothetical protein